MEEVILVDSDDRELGSAEKLRAHQEGLLHRAFSVFIFDSDGRMLIQRRAFAKYHSGGLYTNACCSHPRPGELTIDAAHRRLREEMGFDCELDWAFSFLYEAEFENGLVESEYDHVFLGEYKGEVFPDKDEVADWRWIEPTELRRWLGEKPVEFTPWFKLSLERVLSEPRSPRRKTC
ncbi:MAG: isopentenyl-diphosphate Delta-isomerase [Rhodothermia bacterium]|nr:MAG: isopentenyl-diphosphate Delta-isomerase [Rhodothermia bacterium]